jgi:hypothetical protein
MMALVIVASVVINLGGARHARAHDQDSADAIAIGGAAKLDPTAANNQAACTVAWTYAVSNLAVSAADAPSCVNFAGNCVAGTSRSVTATSGSYTITLTNPVLDDSEFFDGEPVTAADGSACNRFGVKVQQSWQFPFGRGSQTLSVKSMALLTHSPGWVDAPLILLDKHDCNVMNIAGNSTISAVTSTGTPGYIAIDSDGTGCAANAKVIVDATGNAEMTAGGISMWALTTGNVARAYDPSDVGAGRAFNPGPIPQSEPVGRSAIDWRYDCSTANACPYSTPPYITDLVAADGGGGTPAGYTKWSTVYSCNPGTIVVPAGNWYIDCGGNGLSSNGIVTFRGGNIVSDNQLNINGTGTLRINCDVPDSITACPTDPASPSTVYIRNGGFSNAGGQTLIMHETFVYFANGVPDLSGGSTLDWTAPNDSTYPFNDLLMWTNSTSTIKMTGTSTTVFDGIMFAPNAELDLSGNTGSNALGSQMFVNDAVLVGNSQLTLSPHDDRLQALGGANARLIR